MADWRIVTPTREPTEGEMEGGEIFRVQDDNDGDLARIFYSSGDLFVQLYFSDAISVKYRFSDKKWLDSGFKPNPVDITTLDLAIPESALSSATTKTSYFDLIAYENGTTACKLAVANEAKTLIRNALINKGVDVPDTTPFRQYAGKIEGIETGSNIEILTFDIQPDDYENVSNWHDEAYMNQYTEATWSIHGPYKFKLKTYNSLDDLKKDVPIGNIYFSCGEQVFIKRPTALEEGSNFKFISENLGLSGQTLVMIVNFGGGM